MSSTHLATCFWCRYRRVRGMWVGSGACKEKKKGMVLMVHWDAHLHPHVPTVGFACLPGHCVCGSWLGLSGGRQWKNDKGQFTLRCVSWSAVMQTLIGQCTHAFSMLPCSFKVGCPESAWHLLWRLSPIVRPDWRRMCTVRILLSGHMLLCPFL